MLLAACLNVQTPNMHGYALLCTVEDDVYSPILLLWRVEPIITKKKKSTPGLAALQIKPNICKASV